MITDFINSIATNTVGNLLSPGGTKGKLIILTYHRILESDDALRGGDYTREEFEWQMRTLKAYFQVLPLSEAVKRLRRSDLPKRAVCITFDDGYADNHDIALPILKKYDLPATFFIATGFVDGGRMWNDTVIESVSKASGPLLDLSNIGLDKYAISDEHEKCIAIEQVLNALKYFPHDKRVEMANKIAGCVDSKLDDSLMMTSRQIKQLFESGMEIGAHTVSHPILAGLTKEAAQQEISSSQEFLKKIVNHDITIFAYPNGRPQRDYNKETVEILHQLGFDTAVSTAWGSASSHSDPLQLPRISPSKRSPLRFALQILKTYASAKHGHV